MACLFSAHHDSIDKLLETRAPKEFEFHQAVKEVAQDLAPLFEQDENYQKQNIFERIIEPERIIIFKIAWLNDAGNIEVNTGYRVQFNGAIGPYKGGIRFHPSVNLSVLKFLGFEQTFKNALTGMNMGGAKGGADFNPKGRSNNEIMRFCNAYMQELHHYIDPDMDIPAGDINVGSREIGYLFGAYRRLTHKFAGVLSGKSLSFGGSELRTEATGYGVIYFLREVLKAHHSEVEGHRLLISGAGNVASYTAEKAIELGATVVTLSDSTGSLYNKDGFTQENIETIRRIKANSKSLAEFTKEHDAQWHKGKKPWDFDGDIALPCATQNELDEKDAKNLLKNNIKALVEGANMPLTSKAQDLIQESDVIYGPGKAANAGGVAVSGLEIRQNRSSTTCTREEVNESLQKIMCKIHETCKEEGGANGKINYAKGANRAGFKKVAGAMIAQGVG